MYHPSKYKEHNESLQRFANLFNSFVKKNNKNIWIKIHVIENFKDDALVVDEKTGQSFSFDWEKRERYYENCGFPFEDFGQFERKIKKPEIKLSIQCCNSEECFCIAWHSDFEQEEVKKIGSITENGNKEFAGKRFTKKFLELNYKDMDKFYQILRKSFDENKFCSASFSIED